MITLLLIMIGNKAGVKVEVGGLFLLSDILITWLVIRLIQGVILL